MNPEHNSFTEPNLNQNCHSETERCHSLDAAAQRTTNVPWHTVTLRIINWHYQNAYIETNPEKLAVSQLVKILPSVSWAYCAYMSPPPVPVTNDTNSVLVFSSIFFNISFKSLFHLRLGLLRSPLLQVVAPKYCMHFSHSIAKIPIPAKY